MASSFARHVSKGQAIENLSRYVQLQGVPTTALPADIRRTCVKARIRDAIAAVDIDYHNLEPTGSAWLTLSDAAYSSRVVNKFSEGIYLGASRLHAKSNPRKAADFLTRGRGQEGRTEGAERGVVGNGPAGRVSGASRNVAISGLPGRMSVEDVKELLRTFKLAGNADEEREVVKLAKPNGTTSSKFLVRLDSTSEAHRMVRKLHETPYTFNTPYDSQADKIRVVKARVIY